MRFWIFIVALTTTPMTGQATVCFKMTTAPEAIGDTSQPVRDVLTAKMIQYTEGRPYFTVTFEVTSVFKGALTPGQRIDVAIPWVDIGKYSKSKINLLYTSPWKEMEFFAMSCTNAGSVSNSRTAQDLEWLLESRSNK